MYRNLLVILLLSVSLLTGCSKKTDETAARDSAAVADSAKDMAMKAQGEWEEFKHETEVRIDTNKARIDRLKERGEDKYKTTIAQLEARNDTLRARLSNYKVEGETKWQEFKREFKNDMDQLGQSIEDIFKKD